MPPTSYREPPPAFSPTQSSGSGEGSLSPPAFADPAPRYEQTLDQACRRWRAADDAAQQLAEQRPRLLAAQEQLKLKLAELDTLKETRHVARAPPFAACISNIRTN